tara:strand:- start:13971 stop:15311 length:1341 start_codon:yes stop_codon:yes gene_type:complete
MLQSSLYCSSEDWVFSYDGHYWYESDFYRFFPKHEWKGIVGEGEKNNIIDAFLKQNVAAKLAVDLGLNFSFDVAKKVDARYKMLLVNEYYMRHFLGSLIPYSSLVFCDKHLKNEVFSKHILLSFDSDQKRDSIISLAVSIKDSIRAGSSFSEFAIKYSDDPSVGVNGGSLGWVQVGQTVPSFQTGLFSLCLGCVDVVETDFGVHVIGVDSVRSSHYKYMEKNVYDDFVFRFSSAYIEESLKDVAAAHDTLLIADANVVFDDASLLGVVELLDDELIKKGGKRKDVSVLEVLKSYPKVLAMYNSEYIGGAWFANKIESTLHRGAFYATLSEIKKDFTMILLRDIAYKKAVGLGLQNNFSFLSQYRPVKLGVYEKAYMSWLVDGVENPTPEEIENYFMKNKKHTDLKKSYDSIEAILLQQKQKNVKSLYEKSIEAREKIEINRVWLDG